MNAVLEISRATLIATLGTGLLLISTAPAVADCGGATGCAEASNQALPSENGPPAAEAGTALPAPRNQGLRAYIDPETGELTAPPAEQPLTAETAVPTPRAANEVPELVESEAPGGGVMVNLQGHFLSNLTVSGDPDNADVPLAASCAGTGLNAKPTGCAGDCACAQAGQGCDKSGPE
ncbi:MAG: hypothetical protein ACI8TX_001160 [Hyphomicrobiaceae bacterium]|jgi:hypothetical protein